MEGMPPIEDERIMHVFEGEIMELIPKSIAWGKTEAAWNMLYEEIPREVITRTTGLTMADIKARAESPLSDSAKRPAWDRWTVRDKRFRTRIDRIMVDTIAENIARSKAEVARNLLNEGIAEEIIVRVIGLTMADLEAQAKNERVMAWFDRRRMAAFAEGEVKGRAEVAWNLLKMGVAKEIIVQTTGLSLADLEAWAESAPPASAENQGEGALAP